MDLSELVRDTPGKSPDVQRLETLLAQIGAEIAGPLTSAIERINTLASTGQIDAPSLRALRDEVEAARHAGMVGQQLTRFAAGRIRPSHELLQLADVVAHVLGHRQRQTQAHGVTLRPNPAPVQVVADASLLSSLLQASVEWALANAGSPIELTIEPRTPTTACRLACRFSQRATGDNASATEPSRDSLTWRLIEQTAWTMGLQVDRAERAGITCLEFTFPRSADPEARADADLGSHDGFAASANSQPLAGSHVLVIASRREMRMRIRDAVRAMSLIVDFVNSVDEAAAFCREGLPHAVIIEAIQSGERFAQFRASIRAELPDFVFIEILEEGRMLQMSSAENDEIARVGRELLAESLPSVLVFELSKNL